MKLLIKLADFADFTAFSTNISPALVAPYIREAQTFDVKLPSAVRADLETELAAIDPAFKPEDFDTVDFATQAATAGWSNTTLARLWYEAIRPLLVLESARRMLLWHGLHITPNAAEITTDRPISSQQRAELRADLIAKASYYRPLMEAGLRSLAPAPTTTTCGITRRRPRTGGFQSSAV
jgi:hypothetical protein